MKLGEQRDNAMQGRLQGGATTSERLYDRIGQFLDDHRLSPDPAHYAFVHAIMMEPDGAVARAVASLIDDGVRLHQDDIVRLGGPVAKPSPTPAPRARTAPPRTIAPPPEAQSDALAEQTQNQVETFAAVIRAIQSDTSEFGADLARNAEEISRGETISLATLARLTGTMLERVNAAEQRLDNATAEVESLREKLAEARATARRDPLTGLANRLAFSEALAQCFPAKRSCHLALCDVDRFKRINDELGHAVGDRVLHSIASILAEEGKGHVVCRHGGEEFAVLMTGLTTREATQLIERARDAVRERRMRVRETGEKIGEITFSAGITAVRPDDTQETLFARADALLYRAKNEGRDRAFSEE